MEHRTVSATEFKAKCLALLDEVAQQGGTITVTKRGRPVATVGPAKRRVWKSPKGILTGKIHITSDNVDMSDYWPSLNFGGSRRR